MGDGTVKYPGYRTGGFVKPKGMKNKRRAKLREIKEQELREKLSRQQKREELEQTWSDEWNSYQSEE
jgi:hypothetical protein